MITSFVRRFTSQVFFSLSLFISSVYFIFYSMKWMTQCNKYSLKPIINASTRILCNQNADVIVENGKKFSNSFKYSLFHWNEQTNKHTNKKKKPMNEIIHKNKLTGTKGIQTTNGWICVRYFGIAIMPLPPNTNIHTPANRYTYLFIVQST